MQILTNIMVLQRQSNNVFFRNLNAYVVWLHIHLGNQSSHIFILLIKMNKLHIHEMCACVCVFFKQVPEPFCFQHRDKSLSRTETTGL